MANGIDLRVKEEEDKKRAQEKRMHVYRLTEQYTGMLLMVVATLPPDEILKAAVKQAEAVVNWVYADAKRVIDS